MPIKYYQSWCVQSEWVCGTPEYIIQPMGTHSSLSHLQTLSHDRKKRKVFCDTFTSEDKMWDCMDVLSIPHLMNGSRDIWEGPNMRIWTNIGRKGEPGENIFNIPGEDMSWAESMGDNDINGIWTLHRDHMVRRQHLWQIRDISARIRRENIRIKRSLCSHYKTLSITTRVWVVCCGTKRACVI